MYRESHPKELFSPDKFVNRCVKKVCQHDEHVYRRESFAPFILSNRALTYTAQICQPLP